MPKSRHRASRNQPTRYGFAERPAGGCEFFVPAPNYTDRARRALVELRESAGTATLEPPAPDAERLMLCEAGTLRKTGRRRYLARIIEADVWGSSGFYGREVLARDGGAAFPAGTAMFIDHPSVTETYERPERSIRDLAARTVTDATLGADGLYAEVEVYPHAEHIIDSLMETVGLSIRADGTVEHGTAAGRSGPIVASISPGKLNSIDFVTKAGAGGKLMALIEADRTLSEARNLGAWLESRLHLALTQLADEIYGDGRLTRDERIALSGALSDGLRSYTARIERDAPQLFDRDLYDEPQQPEPEQPAQPTVVMVREATSEEMRRALDAVTRRDHGGEDVYVWVRDYDADKRLVWYDVTDPDGVCHTWQEFYVLADGALSLSGDRVEVISTTEYVPVQTPAAETVAVVESAPTPDLPAEPVDSNTSGPGSPPDTTTIEEEGIMPEPTDDTKLREAAEAARVVAEQARDTALREAEESKRELARFRAVESARAIAQTVLAGSDLPAAAQNRVTAQLTASAQVPLTEALAFDETAFRTRLDAEIKAEAAYLAQLREANGEGAVTGLGAAATTTTAAPVNAEATKSALVESFVARGLSPEAAKLAAAGRPV